MQPKSSFSKFGALALGTATLLCASDASAWVPQVPTELDVSTQHACMTTTCGAVECFGGTADQHGETADRRGDFIDVAVGQDHTCGLYRTGAVDCWGDNSEGQLDVPVGVEFKSIDSFMHHTCGITTANRVRCWGRDSWGQVSNAPTNQFRQVSTGIDHSCGITTGTRGLYCWGRNLSFNSNGHLVADETLPGYDTDLEFSQRERWAEVEAGGYHTCARSTWGDVYCFGSNGGRGVTEYYNNDPNLPYGTHIGFGIYQHTGNYRDVSAGYWGTCGVRFDVGAGHNVVQCWGWPFEKGGVYDPPSTSFAFEPERVEVGFQHACVWDEDSGVIDCWGNNTSTPGTPHAAGLTDVPQLDATCPLIPIPPPDFPPKPIFPGW